MILSDLERRGARGHIFLVDLVAVFNGLLLSYVVSCCRYKSLSLSEALYGNVAVHILISCSIWSLQLGSVASGCPSVITRYVLTIFFDYRLFVTCCHITDRLSTT